MSLYVACLIVAQHRLGFVVPVGWDEDRKTHITNPGNEPIPEISKKVIREANRIWESISNETMEASV